MKNRNKGNALAGILATIAVLALVFAGLGVTFGWVTMSDSPDKSTIELNKTELKEDTDHAVEATEKFIKDSAESVEKAAEEASDNIQVEDEQETVTPVPEENETEPVKVEDETTKTEEEAS